MLGKYYLHTTNTFHYSDVIWVFGRPKSKSAVCSDQLEIMSRLFIISRLSTENLVNGHQYGKVSMSGRHDVFSVFMSRALPLQKMVTYCLREGWQIARVPDMHMFSETSHSLRKLLSYFMGTLLFRGPLLALNKYIQIYCAVRYWAHLNDQWLFDLFVVSLKKPFNKNSRGQELRRIGAYVMS